MIKDYVILGGGTAGLTSALFLQRTFPMSNITLIRSTDIGTIGVGEGSTEHWRQMMIHLGIDVQQLVQNTGCTFKTGVRFTNWHGDGTEYWHAIHDGYVMDTAVGTYTLMDWDIAQGKENIDSVWHLARENKHTPPLINVAQYHFDTNKLCDFFTQLCKERGVRIVDDIITDVKQDEDGDVTALVGEKETYNGEFFIDASGFKRVIASKLGAEWIDYTEYLPLNNAIVFPTSMPENMPSNTECRALSSGWMFRIPTQERFGNGYVFCDDFITREEAEKEVLAEVDEPAEIRKHIKFGAGRLKEFWKNNVLCVGLASMFVEPLEATSIGTTIQQLFRLGVSLHGYGKGSKLQQKKYNHDMSEVADNILNFVQIHYITERRDSEFWRWCANEMKLTDWNREFLPEVIKYGPSQAAFNDNPFTMFNYMNWTQVLWGLRLLDKDVFVDRWENHASWRQEFVEQCQLLPPSYPPVPHREALEYIKLGYHGAGDI